MRKLKGNTSEKILDPIYVSVWDGNDLPHRYIFPNSTSVGAIKTALAAQKQWWNMLPRHRQELYVIANAVRALAPNDYVARELMVLSNRPELMFD